MDLPQIQASALQVALTPTAAEVAKAKHLILATLERAVGANKGELVDALLISEGHPRDHDRLHLDLSGNTAIDPSNRHIVLERYRLAGAAALAELASEGLVMPLLEPVSHQWVTVPVARSGSSGGYRVERAQYLLPGTAYALARRLQETSGLVILDLDVFLTDSGLSNLVADQRVIRCLSEALNAFRRGLHLACVALLGAVSEGAWYAAGEKLKHLDPRVAKALGDDNTVKVQERVAEVLRSRLGRRGLVHDLEAAASRLRDVRNYGVHPRSASDASLEHYFTEAGAGLLLLDTHRYLAQLREAVQEALDRQP